MTSYVFDADRIERYLNVGYKVTVYDSDNCVTAVLKSKDELIAMCDTEDNINDYVWTANFVRPCKNGLPPR